MRIGIVGGGQLGRMLGLSAAPLGIDTVFLDPSADACAGIVGDIVTGAFSDPAALDALAEQVDVVTYEFENVDVSELERIAIRRPVLPAPNAVAISQERHREKTFFSELGLEVAPWAYVKSPDDIAAALARTGTPAIAKTDRLGYDGKGQVRIGSVDEAHAAFRTLGGVPLCVEARIGFDYEVSIIGARGRDGTTAIYELTENRHVDGILFQSRTCGSDPASAAALDAFERTVSALDYVGTLAIEFFVVGTDLLVNEFAPRVHNSGHWTLDGAITSQFENHIRAVAGLPLGSAASWSPSGMQNFVGTLPSAAELLCEPRIRAHRYGKAPRPGRKVGHANVVAATPEERDTLLEQLGRLAGHSESQAL